MLSATTAPSGTACAAKQVTEVETSGAAAKATKFEITEIEPFRRGSARRSLRSFPSGRWNARARFDGAPVLAVLIIEFAILGFGKYVISFLQLLELFFRRLVAGVQVGMKLAREFAIRLFDLVVRGTALDAEHLVVVFCLDSHRASFPITVHGQDSQDEQDCRKKRSKASCLLLDSSLLSILSKLFRGVLSIDNFVIGTASSSPAPTTSTFTPARGT